MKKLTFLFLAMFGTCLAGCIFQPNCPDVLPFWKIESISTTNLEVDSGDTSPWRTLYYDTVSVDGYVCEVIFKTDYVALKKLPFEAVFGNELMAKSCDESGMSGHKYVIEDIHFVTLQDYNDSYLANDTLPMLLLGSGNNYTPVSKEVYLDELNKDHLWRGFSVKLDTSIEQEFLSGKYKVIVEVSNGEVFEAETGHVTLVQ